MTAAEAVRKACERLTADVDEIAPPGIGEWDEVWEMVGSADTAFMIAVDAWQADPTTEGQARVREAYDAVLAAWRDAAQQYERMGAA